MAQLYFEQMCKLYGLPRTIVSGRDKIFLSDGQTEVDNRFLEGYLRWMTGEEFYGVGIIMASSCRMVV